MSDLTITWHSHNRAPQCPSDPAYPNGIEVDAAQGKIGCAVDLPYPAECCGIWLIACPVCGNQVAVTAAGRRDDPKRVRIPCKLEGRA